LSVKYLLSRGRDVGIGHPPWGPLLSNLIDLICHSKWNRMPPKKSFECVPKCMSDNYAHRIYADKSIMHSSAINFSPSPRLTSWVNRARVPSMQGHLWVRRAVSVSITRIIMN
jgi:hypothetical protein